LAKAFKPDGPNYSHEPRHNNHSNDNRKLLVIGLRWGELVLKADCPSRSWVNQIYPREQYIKKEM
jgi:hypothetical protein